MKGTLFALLLGFISVLLLPSCKPEEDSSVVRIGHFPNVTHVQALVARNMSRHGEGWFEKYLPDKRFEWYTYNAGPAAMEAVFGSTVDFTYVGPSPAINAFAVAQGGELRLLAGAVNGGAGLVVSPQSGIASTADIKGKTLATPQLGNTQDISCRAWLKNKGFHFTLEGRGDVRVSPTPNAMQLQFMKQGDIDASWTVEPWVSRLEKMAGAKLLVDEPDVVTTVLVGRLVWLQNNPELAATMLRAHAELTQWILDNPRKAQAMVTEELALLTQGEPEPDIVQSAWARMKLTTEINLDNMKQFVKDAEEVDLLERVPPLEGMLYTPATPTQPTPAP